jgi:hypothetical protein
LKYAIWLDLPRSSGSNKSAYLRCEHLRLPQLSIRHAFKGFKSSLRFFAADDLIRDHLGEFLVSGRTARPGQVRDSGLGSVVPRLARVLHGSREYNHLHRQLGRLAVPTF